MTTPQSPEHDLQFSGASGQSQHGQHVLLFSLAFLFTHNKKSTKEDKEKSTDYSNNA